MKSLATWLAWCLVSASASEAQSVATPTVESVVTATNDAHDIAIVDERTLIATSGGLVVMRGDRVERVTTSLEGLPGARLRSVSVTPAGVWLGGIEGTVLVRFNASSEARVVRTLALRRVRRVVEWQGATWIGTYGDGLFRLTDAERGEPTRLRLGRSPELGRITDLVPFGSTLAVATAGEGVLRLDSEGRIASRLRRAEGLADNFVWDLVRDGERLLVGTLAGLSVVGESGVERQATLARQVSRLQIRDVRAVVRTADGVWIGTFGAGLWRIRTGNVQPTRVGAETVNRVRALSNTSSGVVIAHELGAHRWAGTTLTRIGPNGLPSADVTALARAFGATWVGTFDQGLARITNGQATAIDRAVVRFGMDRRINDLAVTRTTGPAARETLWIATDRGLFWHDGRRFAPALGTGAPESVHVAGLYVESRTGALWVATSRALFRYDDDRWTSWTGDANTPVLQLHSVTTDAAGNVWIGSLHGLLRLDVQDGTFARHTVSSGALPVDWVTSVSPWNGGIVAGTYHGGLVWYDGRTFRIEREADGLPAGWVNPHAMERIGNSFYVGTMERGLLIGRSGNWTRLRIADGLPSDDVTDILPESDRSALIATRGGLARIRW